VDAFVVHEGTVIRYMALYSENIMLDFTDDQIMGVTEIGIEDLFEATDEYLTEQAEE